VNVILDAGALIAIDRNDRSIAQLLVLARRNQARIFTTPPVVTQVWRNGARQANLARALSVIETEPVSMNIAKRAGELLASSNTSDAVDALVALLVTPGDQVWTSDPNDLQTLLQTRNIPAQIVTV
jgi:predicted nucleic acid-binding protein